MSISRAFWVVAHRWAGLTIAVFLVIAGLTGSLLSFYHELYAVTAPQVILSEPQESSGEQFDPLVLRARAEQFSGGRIDFVSLEPKPGHSLVMGVSTPPGGTPLGFDQIAMNSYTGAEQARFTWGAITEGWHNVMPFIYRLHHTLAAGDWGNWAFGIAALIWTIDCLVGFYLTLPISKRGWWQRWRKAWTVRRPFKWGHKLNFDLHLVSGLWVWPILLVFAWSSVGFNLPQVYEPVTTAIFGTSADKLQGLAMPIETPRIGWEEARDRGRALAVQLGKKDGFEVLGEQYIGLDRKHGVWRYGFKSSRENLDRFAESRVLFDANTGELRTYSLPSGQNPRSTFESWLYGLHMAQVWGLPYRLFVVFLGFLVTALSVTGIIIWMKKRSARIARGRKFREASYSRRAPVPAE